MSTLTPPSNPTCNPKATRRSFVPTLTFSLHGAPYDPPNPTVAPPPASAPIVVAPVSAPVPAPSSPRPPAEHDENGDHLLTVRPPPTPRRRSFFGGEGALPPPASEPSTSGTATATATATALSATGSAAGGGSGKTRNLAPPPTPTPRSAGARVSSVQAVQAEIDETVAIMRCNLQAMAERGETLERLESRTETLVVAARGFRKSAQKVRRDMWWKDMKMRLIIGLAITVVVALTVLSIVQAVRRAQPKAQAKRDLDLFDEGAVEVREVEARDTEWEWELEKRGVRAMLEWE
ncbi:putative synaptobrevin [Lyophyllum shimeji]|uniref:Synaptobrevin n=1 Tax=Lyophyllum shimeji TaxID=47721 RepID=A0A9P3PZ42_LYOSH|nr:putative synaptobrevin [Lyophyllum shimeji]